MTIALMTTAVRLGLTLEVAVAKVGKYATSESGDTVEVVERPHGGLSVVVVDGQRSGKSAKAVSNIVARKAMALLADGVRDGAVARAAHDYLRTQRGGKVSATLNLASVDLASRTLVLLRNNHCPILLYNPHWTGVNTPDGWQYLDEPSEAIGVHARTRPIATELPLQQDLTALIFTDGIWTAGERSGQRISIPRTVQEAFDNGVTELNDLADFLLTRAVELDQRRPADDMSLVILGIRGNDNEDEARRMTVSLPF